MAKKRSSKARRKAAEPEIRSMDLEEFLRRLSAEKDEEEHFVFFLGAGCSVTSGIPSAAKLVKDRWIPRLRDYEAPDRSDLDEWAREVIEGYDPENPASSYGALIDRLFLTPDKRQREIEDLCDGRTPSFGYAVLAQLIAQQGGRFNIVLTTNFDDLVSDALYLYTEARPLVIHHESLAAYIRPTRTRPLVVKLHGDHRLSPRNTALETEELEKEIQRHTAMVLHDRGLIFMGYGGADHGILKMLDELPPAALPFGAFWVHPHEPRGVIREWLCHRQGVWVRSGWFDEVMLLFRDEFDLPHPSKERFARIFDDYQRKFQDLSDSIDRKPDDEAGLEALKKARNETEALFPDHWRVVSEASRLERQDPDRADEIYRRGIEQFPDAAPLLGDYAVFLSTMRHDNDAAEVMYKRALVADPQYAHGLANYAYFLESKRRDWDGAEAIYKRALEADPKSSHALSNYAYFLESKRRDIDTAEAFHKQALEAVPRSANALGDYAAFMSRARNDNDAAETLYRQALEADPKHVHNLDNYAIFLQNKRHDDDGAEALFKRALEANPHDASVLGHYAYFLESARQNRRAAESMYRKALEAGPLDANTLTNLSGFLLADGRKDGHAVLQQAFEQLRDTYLPDAELECAFYLFAHGKPTERAEALRIERRLLESGVRSVGWDLSRNIKRARSDNHPESEWLDKLAAVVADNADIETLNEWSAWRNATEYQ